MYIKHNSFIEKSYHYHNFITFDFIILEAGSPGSPAALWPAASLGMLQWFSFHNIFQQNVFVYVGKWLPNEQQE